MCQRAKCNRIAVSSLSRIAEHISRTASPPTCRVRAHELGCLCEQTDAVQRQEVRFVDDLAELKRIGLVIARPLDHSRISATLDDAAFGAATSEQSR